LTAEENNKRAHWFEPPSLEAETSAVPSTESWHDAPIQHAPCNIQDIPRPLPTRLVLDAHPSSCVRAGLRASLGQARPSIRLLSRVV
jgi:hypothetical protein